MPSAPKRPCRAQGCAHLTPPTCPVHGKPKDTRSEFDRRASDPWRWIYKTSRWAKARTALFRQFPLCVDCAAENRVVAATDAHHDPPLRELLAQGRLEQDFDSLAGLVALCVTHHRLRDSAQRRKH